MRAAPSVVAAVAVGGEGGLARGDRGVAVVAPPRGPALPLQPLRARRRRRPGYRRLRSSRSAASRRSPCARSSVSTPSRWSSSCWSTRAPGISDVEHHGLAMLVAAAPGPRRPRDLDPDARDREADLLGGLGLLARPLELRVHERLDGPVGLGPVDEHAVHDPELRRRQPCLHRVLEQPAHLERSGARTALSTAARGRARARRAGSPYLRTAGEAASGGRAARVGCRGGGHGR